MSVYMRVFLAIGGLMAVIVLGGATWAALHSDSTAAIFILAAAVGFVLLIVGGPLVILRVTISASSKRQVTQSAKVAGNDVVGFATVLTAKVSRQLRSARVAIPATFLTRMSLMTTFITADSRGILLSFPRSDEGVQIAWARIAEVSHSESGRAELRFPTIVISMRRPGGSVDMKFVAPRADPVGARNVARQFEALRQASSAQQSVTTG